VDSFEPQLRGRSPAAESRQNDGRQIAHGLASQLL
jgi:hypothetical protein